MEVKIKEGNGYVDADWTIEDGIMVVSPKVVKFEPKDGDVVFSGISLISIFKEMTSDTSMSAYAAISNGELIISFGSWSASDIRPATEEEKKLLFDKLADKGYSWDAERKKLVKIKWKPKEGEIYFLPRCDVSGFHVRSFDWEDTRVENKYYEKGWIYKTKEESQEFCNRLNEAISQVKP